MNEVILIENLTKCYGSNKAVDNISFSVNKGEILGFLGPNGAGKSTTMNMLTGYLSKDIGKVSVCGFDILESPKEVKRRIGYLPEQPPIYLDMTVSEYLLFICDVKGVSREKQEHIDKIMTSVGILHMKGRLIKNLSKGYKQRVGLAGALVGDPDVLILDEPTVGLDPRQIIEIRNVIRNLGKEKTIILSTHILQEVTAVCDRVIIINRGKIVYEDTMDNLSSKEKTNTYTLRIKGDRNTINEIVKGCKFISEHTISMEKEEGAYDVTVSNNDNSFDIREALFNLFSQNGMPILSFVRKALTLEEIFVSVTNTEVIEEEEKETETEEKSFLSRFKISFLKKENKEVQAETIPEMNELQKEDGEKDEEEEKDECDI